MIGKWLSTITPEMEDRLLTREFRGDVLWCACMVGTAFGARRDTERVLHVLDRDGWNRQLRFDAGIRYEILRIRFGLERANAAIRNRILSNRARRTLTAPQQVPEYVLRAKRSPR